MDPSKLIRPGDLWAVFAGVNEYDDPEWGPLPYCDKDAADLASLFMDATRGGYTASNIRLLRDSNQKRFLKPTRSNILAAIRHLAEVADREDTILFGFFGHGFDVEGVSYLFPSDGLKSHPQETAIALKWVQDTLQNSQAQVKVLIFDACHSGALRARAGTGRMSRAFAHTLFDELVQSEGWAVLSACKQDELSHDYDEKQHGVFTYFLLEGLSGTADADGDGFITVCEASRYATIQTKRWAFQNGVQQNPELKWNISGDIVLLKSGREAPLDAWAAANTRDSARIATNQEQYRQSGEATVLWVDDRPDNNRFERQALETLGIRFVLSTSTDDALRQIQRHPFDVIISDMGRPPDPRAGYTLLDTLRRRGDQTPFVIYAGSNALEHKAEARRHGAIGSTNDARELFQLVFSAFRGVSGRGRGIT